MLKNTFEDEIFKYKLLELMYSIQKYNVETLTPKELFPKFKNSNINHPTELNTLIFLTQSFYELFIEYDPKIFEKNKHMFNFIRSFRNNVWHKSVYKNQLRDY